MLADHHRTKIGRAVLGDQLRRHARTNPDRVAVVSYAPDRSETTYGQLDARANRYAHLLLARGVGRGDVVAVMARNSVEVIALYYGALKIGAALTCVNVMLGEREVAQQLDHAQPAAAFASPEFAALVPDAVELGAGLDDRPATEPDADVDEHDVAMLVYTSGTEAAPKGVLIPHRNYLISTAPAWSWGLQTGPEDTWLFVMPFFTIAGLGSMTTLTLMGATLVLPSTVEPAAAL